jgi:arylsulfatase A-like enzyme
MPEVNWNDWDDIPSGAEKMVGKEWLWNGMMKADSIRPGAWKEAVRAYQVCATFADKQIGKIIAALEKSPYAENTIIVVWSDHGFHLGEKEHWEKFALWEKTTQVPFIVVGPGVTPPGTVYGSPVNLLDIYPTLLDLCGFEEKPGLDGESLVNVLKDPEYERNRPALMTYGKGNHAIRTDRWRYIHYKDGTEELYDHRNDPREWNNLAGDDQYENLKDSLKQWLPESEADSVPDMKRPEDL